MTTNIEQYNYKYDANNLPSIKNREYTIIIDQSLSMKLTDCKDAQGKAISRWDAVAKSIEKIVATCLKNDRNGIELYFFDSYVSDAIHVTNADQIKDIFGGRKPQGSTDLAGALDKALQAFFKKRESGGELCPETSTKSGETIIVITDGKPDDEEKAKNVIIDAANGISSDADLAISFFQIGKNNSARKYLKDLDNGLIGKATFDIVDTKEEAEIKEIGLEEALMKAITS